MKKQLYTFALFILPLLVTAQNVGIGTNTPGTTLDVNGGFSTRSTFLTLTGPSGTIPNNTSFVLIDATINSNSLSTLTGPVTPSTGQHLIIRATNSNAKLSFANYIFYGQQEFVYDNLTSTWAPVQSSLWTGGIATTSSFLTLTGPTGSVPNNISYFVVDAAINGSGLSTLNVPSAPLQGQRLIIRATNSNAKLSFANYLFYGQQEFVYESITSNWTPLQSTLWTGGIALTSSFLTLTGPSGSVPNNTNYLVVDAAINGNNLSTLSVPTAPLQGQRLLIRATNTNAKLSFANYIFYGQQEFVYESATATWAPVQSNQWTGGIASTSSFLTLIGPTGSVPSNISYLVVDAAINGTSLSTLSVPSSPLQGQRLMIKATNTNSKISFSNYIFYGQQEFVYESATATWAPVQSNQWTGGIASTSSFLTLIGPTGSVPNNISYLVVDAAINGTSLSTLGVPSSPLQGQRLMIKATNTNSKISFANFIFYGQQEFVYESATATWAPVQSNQWTGGIASTSSFLTLIGPTGSVPSNISYFVVDAAINGTNISTLNVPSSPLQGQRLVIRATNSNSKISFANYVFYGQQEFVYESATSTWAPVRSSVEPFVAATLNAGWTNYGNSYASVAYYKDQENRVHLRGLLNTGTIGSVIFTLPIGYRPSSSGRLMFNANNGNSLGRIDIDIAGNVIFSSGPVTVSWLSLDGITFRAD